MVRRAPSSARSRSNTEVVVPALIVVAAGMLLVRLGWGGRRGVAAAGWLLAAAALAVLTARDGAWGLAVGTVAGMAVALAMVLYAAWVSPAKTARAPRQAPAITLPRRPRDLLRRVAVFALVVPVAFAAAQWLAYGGQALARRNGWAEADSLVLMLFGQPVVWLALMSIQMTRPGPLRMISAPAVAAMIGTLLWALA